MDSDPGKQTNGFMYKSVYCKFIVIQVLCAVVVSICISLAIVLSGLSTPAQINLDTVCNCGGDGGIPELDMDRSVGDKATPTTEETRHPGKNGKDPQGGNRMEKYLEASDKVAKALAGHVTSSGQLNVEGEPDLAFYYKLPTTLLLSGYLKEADSVLNFIKATFLQENGDVLSPGGIKTANGALVEFESYCNGWIAMGAQRAGRFDLSQPMLQFFMQFYNQDTKRFARHQPSYVGATAGHADTLTLSHAGFIMMNFGMMDKAIEMGKALQSLLDKQPDLESRILLCVDNNGSLVTEYPEGLTPFYVIEKAQANQLYFMAGYPVAFLAKLSLATGDQSFLNSSKAILDFLIGSHKSIYSFHFAHKVAWAASIVAKITKEVKYKELSMRIADFLLSIQGDDGLFLTDAPPIDRYDQSAEIGIWLREIYKELNS